MNNLKDVSPAKSRWLAIGLLALVLVVLFWRSFLPDYVFFNNDGPLGVQNAAWVQMPSGMIGMWVDLNYLGTSGGAYTPSITAILHSIMSPVVYAKYYQMVALFIVGVGTWAFFRQLKFSALASLLGGLAAMLNSTFFSGACWGVGTQELALGINCFALALVVGCTPNMSALVRWVRIALAGLCVGINVIEAADIGALYSMLVALFIFFHALSESEGTWLRKTIRGVMRVAVVAVFAAFIAYQALFSLVGLAIQGVSGTSQDTETKAQRYDWATQWSEPKAETFGLLVPGLFGYKMDTSKDMAWFRDSYRNGVYWGGMGRDPNIDRWLDAGSQGPQPSGFMRFTGGGNYCGVLVLLIAAWTIAQAFRRQNSVFPDQQKRMILFWAVVMLLCLLFAWGRFAPFYALLYKLPYFSTIRNPAKFLIFFSWALVIIFAYGVNALERRYLNAAGAKGYSIGDQFKSWWAKVSNFDRKWAYGSLGFLGACVLGWLIYIAQKPAMLGYLAKVGFGGTDASTPNSGAAIFAFSVGQVGWFLVLLALAVGLVLLVIAGYFSGPRSQTGALLLGAFLIVDLGRADLPWIVNWDYKQKYEVGTLNPILKFLLDKPYEHRVAGLPFRTPPGLELFDELYRIEWVQHHFPYYNIQSLDIVQMPRLPEDIKAYKEALAPHGDAATTQLIAREWELTSTRYLLGPAGYLEVMNQQLDPAKQRFRILQRFEVVPKPGISQPTRLEELTAAPSEGGNYALFEFTGALPRAKVYSSWEVSTNDQPILKTLGDLNFDPANTVLVSTPAPGVPAAATNENSGTVEYTSYSTKHIVFSTQTTSPSVLLLNDRYDSMWSVTVDGQPAPLLRCNFIMRGVYLPTPGAHKVEFQFNFPHKPIFVTFSAMALALLFCGFLAFDYWKRQTVRP